MKKNKTHFVKLITQNVVQYNSKGSTLITTIYIKPRKPKQDGKN